MKLKVLSALLALISLGLSGYVIANKVSSVDEYDKGVLGGVCMLTMMQSSGWTEGMGYHYCKCMVNSAADVMTDKQVRDAQMKCVDVMIKAEYETKNVE